MATTGDEKQRVPQTEKAVDDTGRELEVYDPTSVPSGIIRGAPHLKFTPEQKEIVRSQIAPDATDDELAFVIAYATRVGLDPIAKQMYAIPRQVSKKTVNADGQEVWVKERRLTIQSSIDGLRLVAQRTGDYAGRRGPEWCGPDGDWRDVWLDDESPAAARVGVLRHGFVEPLYAVAHWREYVPRGGQDQMWQKMPAGQLAKCAEALALRGAFPAELSGIYTDDEMAQARDTDPTGGTNGVRKQNVGQQRQRGRAQQSNRNVQVPKDVKNAIQILEGIGVQFVPEWIKEAATIKYGEVPQSFQKLSREQRNEIGAVLIAVCNWFDDHYAEIETPIGPAATLEQTREAFAEAMDGSKLEGPVEMIAGQKQETDALIFKRQVELGLRNEDGTFTEDGQRQYGVSETGDTIEDAEFTPVENDAGDSDQVDDGTVAPDPGEDPNIEFGD